MADEKAEQLGGTMETDNRVRDDSVPRIVHEDDMARMERIIKRQVYVIFFLILLIGAMLYEWTRWDYEDITVDSSSYGNAAYMGDGASGVINNGRCESTKASPQEP